MINFKLREKESKDDVNLELYLERHPSDTITLVCKSGSVHRAVVVFKAGGWMRLQNKAISDLSIGIVND